MTTPLYELSEDAEADLREILRYTIESHGPSQARKYADQLQECVEQLSTGKARSKKFPDVHKDLRYSLCQHHYVFGLYR